MADYNRTCPVCDKDFIAHKWNAKYCCDKCRMSALRECQYASNRKWYKKNRSRSSMREKTCVICGQQYIGHFNSKYCISCLEKGDKQLQKYLENRVDDYNVKI